MYLKFICITKRSKRSHLSERCKGSKWCWGLNGMPGVGLMVRVVGFGSWGPEFKSRSAVALIPGWVNSACHPSEVGKMSASMLVYCVSVATRPGLYPIAKETA